MTNLTGEGGYHKFFVPKNRLPHTHLFITIFPLQIASYSVSTSSHTLMLLLKAATLEAGPAARKAGKWRLCRSAEMLLVARFHAQCLVCLIEKLAKTSAECPESGDRNYVFQC
jgi:hypothetical protein